MAGGNAPGVTCVQTRPTAPLADGSLCLQPSAMPGSMGAQASRVREFDALREALAALEATALNFGRAFINDAGVRENYVRKIHQMAQQVLDDVRAGRATAQEGARFAVEMRNAIMEEARLQSSVIGRAQAERLKAAGKPLAALVDEKVAKLFPGRTFAQLSVVERRQVFESIIESAGRSRASVTASIPRWRLVGRGCVVFTVAVSTYNIWTAENKVHAGLREGLVLGGGAAGGALAGAATGLVCGPGAPVCSTALFIVGGIMGALAGSTAADLYDEQLREFADWLGEGF